MLNICFYLSCVKYSMLLIGLSVIIFIILRPSSQVDGRPPCVNGDIAIQWEWSNFDPSQNQNPFTNYDETLHNWLRPRDEQVTQNLCQSAVRVCLGKYVK